MADRLCKCGTKMVHRRRRAYVCPHCDAPCLRTGSCTPCKKLKRINHGAP